MHLKTLTLRGFKSFASATTLHFEPGITAVVGPNGSGKSNVVDALAWVMGEQGAKSLRGGAMADVIFAGTSTRSPLGRAEVSLTIDNADGALPIAYTEVTITRTLFRGGGSEYAINGTACRLLDIQELLSDTGMGREMHVIVGQGQLDAVLTATSEERRGFIEEAAGILKHRRRKEKALRKLDSMGANLQRVTDLTSEIRRQLGPLARQADVARRASVIQADVRDARSRLLADDIVQAQALIAAETADETALTERKRGAENRLNQQRTFLAQAEVEAAAKAPELRQTTETYYALAALKERFASLAQVASERCRNLGSPMLPIETEDPEALAARARRVRAEEAELRTAADSAKAALVAAEASRKAAEASEREAEHALAAVHRGVADRREGLARLTGQVATRRSRLESAEAELERTRTAAAAARARADEAEREYSQLERDAVGAEDGEGHLDDAHERALEAHERARAALEVLVESERDRSSRRETVRARLEALQMSVEHADATAALIERGVAGLRGYLPESITVTGGWDEAIVACLGTLSDAAVATDSGVAVDAMRLAHDEELGTVRLVIAAGTESHAQPAPQGTIWAHDAVTASDPNVGHAITALLAGIVLVEDLSEARATAEAHPELTAVTRTGDLLSRTRAIGGAEVQSNVFARQAAIVEASDELSRLSHEIERITFELVPAREAVEAARRDVVATLDALHESDAQIAAVAEKLGRLGAAIRSARSEAERAEPAITRLLGECDEHRNELATLAERLEHASREPEEAEDDLAAATQIRDTAGGGAREARRVETDSRLELRTLEERAGALSGRAASLEAAAAAEREARRRATEKEARRARTAAVAAVVRDDATLALRATERSVQLAAEARSAAEEARDSRDAQIALTRDEIQQLADEVARLTDEAHRDEMIRAEQSMKLAALTERAVAELGVDPEVLVEEYGPHQFVPQHVPGSDEQPAPRPYVREEQEKRLVRAERDLVRLGKVNPLALEEHAALAERHTFLTEQMRDLKKSRDDLMGIVGEIDTRVESVFTEAFADTAREFEIVFDRLFPGGEGRLVLTNPGDMLNTGIEIEARPAGKKVKRLSLLSGGERSLTAVALLVAIFKARPSPFYVMDEVEAALDDVNLSRLLEIFRELQEDSQLIVVTHQKRTMEIADSLYGVTMRNDGVTQVISQRLDG